MVGYIFFLISSTLLGSFYVGPVSIRVYATILMLCYLLISRGKEHSTIAKQSASYIRHYVIFILLMGIAMLFSGDFLVFNYPKNVLAYHLVAITSFYATLHFVKTQKQLLVVLQTISAIVLATSIVTIMQFNGNSFGWYISGFFGEMTEHVETNLEYYSDTLLGASYACGIMQKSFLNAIYISSCSILMLAFIKQEKLTIINICIVLLFMLCAYACFATQQRGAFYMLLVVILFILTIKLHWKMIFLFPVILFVVSLPNFNNMFSSDEMGRLAIENLSNDELRTSLWNAAKIYIMDNIMWGGITNFKLANNGLAAHNFFYNAFIYSGLIGGLTIIALFIRVVMLSLKKVLENRSKYNETFFISLALLCYLTQGIVHNTSLITGDLHIMTMLALLICANKINTSHSN